MKVVRRELHYMRRGQAWCGQLGDRVNVTDEIEDVTCRKCVDRIYDAAVKAHYRAFPEFRGPRARKVARLVRKLGIEGSVKGAS